MHHLSVRLKRLFTRSIRNGQNIRVVLIEIDRPGDITRDAIKPARTPHKEHKDSIMARLGCGRMIVVRRSERESRTDDDDGQFSHGSWRFSHASVRALLANVHNFPLSATGRLCVNWNGCCVFGLLDVL